MPDVEWFLNVTRLLNSTNPRIMVTITNDSSMLTVKGLEQDEGGNYSCIFENSRGIAIRNVTTLLILS